MSKCKYVVTKIVIKPNTEAARSPTPVPLFSCKNDIETYNCASCSFRTCAFALLAKHHRRSHSASNNPSKVEFKMRNYYCRRSHFATYSALHWLQHCMTCLDDKAKLAHRSMLYNRYSWKLCDKCNYRTTYNQALLRHKVAKHGHESDVQWYQCEHCSYRSKYKITLQRHEVYAHLEKAVLKTHRHLKHAGMALQCERQDETNARQPLIKLTKKSVRENGTLWFKCDTCDFEAKNKMYLKRHVIACHRRSGPKQIGGNVSRHPKCVDKRTGRYVQSRAVWKAILHDHTYTFIG